jgi:hypothetical protein
MDVPKKFVFYVRKPNWSSGIKDETTFAGFSDGYYVVARKWNNGDTLSVTFKNEINVKSFNNNSSYIQRGPIVYAFDIPHREEVIKTYSDSKFKDYYCFPYSQDFANLELTQDSKFTLSSKGSSDSFYTNNWYLEGDFFDSSANENIRVKLIPMGKTILRRVTFPLKK